MNERLSYLSLGSIRLILTRRITRYFCIYVKILIVKRKIKLLVATDKMLK